MAPSFMRFLDHTQRRTTVSSTPLDEWSARRGDLYLKTHNTQKETDIHPPGEIRTHNLSKRTAADPRLIDRTTSGTGIVNPLTPSNPHRGRTAPLTSKSCILYIYSTNICTEYFKHGIYSPFFPLQNAICFIILTYLVPVLFTFYIQDVVKLKKIILTPKG